MCGGCPCSHIIISKLLPYTKIYSNVNIIFELVSHWCYYGYNRSSNSNVIINRNRPERVFYVFSKIKEQATKMVRCN